MGYYALVDFAFAIPVPDHSSVACEWWDLHDIKELFMDHKHILNRALETLRLQLNHQPIGYNFARRIADRFRRRQESEKNST